MSDEPAAPAGVPLWRRVVARLLDYLTAVAILFALQVLRVTFWVDSTAAVIALIAVIAAAVEIPYLAIRGQTPGKELLRFKVVRDSGEPLGWRLATTRWALPGLSLLLPPVLVPAVMTVLGLPAIADDRRRAAHDRLARTVVVPYDAKAVEGPIRTRRELRRLAAERALEDDPGDDEGF
jgi:uncharacterized RDD family membrane protein YckC